MKVRCRRIAEGPGPSEAVVEIATTAGPMEEVIVHTSLISADSVEVHQVGSSGDSVLVELPRESLSGRWRLWVPSATLQ